ncbi:MAG: T9SS type A sorting domain-containing protein [Bacteroidales bacterium]|nr:T9SS type A sorting domain-containing protein [Bacteroidales bacterium]
MRKFFTFLIAIFVAQLSFGQTFVNENFSGTAWPPAGWSFDGLPGQWARSATANAGGAAPEARFTYIAQTTTTRFVSPAFDLSSITDVTLTFKYFYDWYANGVTFGVAKRFGTTGTWEIAWSVLPTGNQGPKTQVVDFTNIGQAGFQFCFFLQGNLYNIDYLYIDDVKLFKRENLDAGLQSLDVPSYFLGERNVSGKIANEGITTLTSFDVNYSINDGEAITTSFGGLNITTGNTFDYTCVQPLNLNPGLYSLKVWVSNVNGVAVDDNPSNDMITKNVGVPTQTLQRRPLFEEFTSSTCAPCASFNNSVFNPFVNQNGENIALIKYQMSWPAPGDPYYTAEGGVRRVYYGVSAVPQLFTEGKGVATSAAAVNNAYNAGMADPAFVMITGTHLVEGTNFTVNANITPYVSLTNATLHVVILERLTTGNVGNNGETSFKHVMMKMMPDASGTTMNMESGVTTSLSFTHDMSTTHMEQMDDLVAVIFVQDNSNKYVFQAAYTQEAGSVAATVTFDPINGATGITTEADLNIHFDMPVFLIGGGDITNDNVADLITLHQVGGDAFPFTATINDEKTVITVSPVGLLNSYTNYTLGIADVQNANGVVTSASSINFETGMHVGVGEFSSTFINITPNPANEAVNISYFTGKDSKVTISLLDLNGRLVRELYNGTMPAGQHQFNWNASDISSGVYMIRLNTNENVSTSRLIIKK